MPQIAFGRFLVAGLVLAAIGVGGSMLGTLMPTPGVDMRIEPQGGTRVVGELFTIAIVVEADEPVNVFKGDMRFDPDALEVDSINYNTSIADLWAERPWYENGEGTLNFIGGSTMRGGFTGIGTLITVTFKTKQAGKAAIAMNEVRILRHDGLGTDAVVSEPIDAIFTIDNEQLREQTIVEKSSLGSTVRVLPERMTTDLNGDGKMSIRDVSIFMSHLATQNITADFNGDGKVNTSDLSIILDAASQ